MLRALANLEEPPESVPINMLVPIPGTPLEGATKVEPLESYAPLRWPESCCQNPYFGFQRVDEPCLKNFRQCVFFAGANSIFVGDRLLTTDNVEYDHDAALFDKLGIVEMLPDVDEKPASSTAEFRVAVSQ